MAEQPTYEELHPGLEEPEKEAASLRLAEQALKRTDQDITTILDTLLEHVVYQDIEMKVLWANQAACNSVGMTRKDLIGRHCYEVWAGRQNTCEDCPVERARDTGKAQEVEKMTPDGRWWHIAGYPVRDDSSRVGAMVELTLDITERKRAQEALQQSEERFRQMAELSPFPISTISSQGRYLYLNKKFTEVFGYTLEDIPTGRYWFHKAYPDAKYRRKVISTWKSDLKRFSVYEVRPRQFRVTCKDGTLREIVFRPVSLDDGNQFITYEDLTEHMHAEVELKKHRYHLEETNTALRVLLKRREEDKVELEEKVLSNVKDLVLPYLERLQKTSLDANQISCLGILESNLNDIVSPFSYRLSSKYLRLTPTEIRVANLIKEGRTTKEIAEFLNLSDKTIQTHRDNIRKKMGIKHKKTNLRTYLSTLK